MTAQTAIIIGSGFGGAVAACRLAQAGIAVTVLERGRRYDREPSGFPRIPPEMVWQTARGPFDIRPLSEIQICQAAGYGGGSLIYANVHLRLPPDAFAAAGWPAGYSRELLDPYYDLVAYMLDIKPITADGEGPPAKSQKLRAAAQKLGRQEQLIHPPLAIDFSGNAAPHRNKFGVTQNTCVRCGECVIGCTHRAKNTLDFNYLAVAEKHKARMLTGCEALRIEPRANGVPGYRVVYREVEGKGATLHAEADLVFVCAGAVNSTELLLRSRAAGALSKIGPELGQRYSGNGDLLAFAFETREAGSPNVGPTITTALLYDDRKKEGRSWFLIEEGGFPREIWPMVDQIQGPRLPSLQVPLQLPIAQVVQRPSQMENAAVFLAMGRDLANGRIELQGEHLTLKWDFAANFGLYNLQERLLQDIAKELGGGFAGNPFWSRARLPISVHNLGGCRMGNSDVDGVTDSFGEVFHYPGLFVLDGALLPGATGVNPSHTIAAVAERNIEHVIRRELRDDTWIPAERKEAKPFVDPLSSVNVPAQGTPPPATSSVGLRFSERMTGTWTMTNSKAPGVADAKVQITVPDIAAFIAQPQHTGVVTGTLQLDGLTDGPVPVNNGVWNLFVLIGDGPEREMRYTLRFQGKDGKLYTLYGTKRFVPRAQLAIWEESTTLHFNLYENADMSGTSCGSGTISIGLLGVMKLGSSLEAIGARSDIEGTQAKLDFVAFCMNTLKKVEFAGNSWLG